MKAGNLWVRCAFGNVSFYHCGPLYLLIFVLIFSLIHFTFNKRMDCTRCWKHVCIKTSQSGRSYCLPLINLITFCGEYPGPFFRVSRRLQIIGADCCPCTDSRVERGAAFLAKVDVPTLPTLPPRPPGQELCKPFDLILPIYPQPPPPSPLK